MEKATALLLVLAALTPGSSSAKDILVVFNVEAKKIDLHEKFLESLADYIATTLASSENHEVIPRATIRSRLPAKKLGTFKRCFEKKCQIALGRELAATKAVRSQIRKKGKQCLVRIGVFDLKKPDEENGAGQKGGCTERELVRSLNHALLMLRSIQPRHPEPAPKPTGNKPRPKLKDK